MGENASPHRAGTDDSDRVMARRMPEGKDIHAHSPTIRSTGPSTSSPQKPERTRIGYGYSKSPLRSDIGPPIAVTLARIRLCS